MTERIAIVDGLRSPMGKFGGAFKDIQADELGAKVLRELISKLDFDSNEVDEVIIGNVSNPAHAANIARVISLYAGLSSSIPAFTVHRNCASGMEAVSSAIMKIYAGYGKIFLCGGVESMSNIPLLFNKQFTTFIQNLSKTKTIAQKLNVLRAFRLSFLKPDIALTMGLTDPICGLIMGLTAENIVRDFNIKRSEQDNFALNSHKKAEKAIESGIFNYEITPIYTKEGSFISIDEGVRNNQTLEALSKLKPYFDKEYGTVTVGNSSQITDGACMIAITSESHAKKLGLNVLGYIKDFAYAGCDGSRMGLGPVFSTVKLFKKTGIKLKDIGLFEINEAFAGQVLGCLHAFNSEKFFKDNFNNETPLGEIDPNLLNVNGGAIALGHPVGMTGTRILLHLIKEMKRREVPLGLASLCIGGGQGASFLLEL